MPPSLAASLWLLALVACSGEPPAQCTKPTLPPNGLAIQRIADQDVTYTDGYRTRGDLVCPSAAPPSCRWPLVILVHGSGGDRHGVAGEQDAIAGRGFAVWAYDVRGQGDGIVLNPGRGMTLFGGAETFDLAEQILFARAHFPALVSTTKVAVTGFSQGAIHSWLAAAYSGRTLTVAGRGTVAFPQIAAVAPRDFVPDYLQYMIPGGTLFTVVPVERFIQNRPGVVYDPALQSLGRQYFAAQDPQGLENALAAEPGRPVAPLLASSAVPILYAHGHHDALCAPLPALQDWPLLPATTPARLVLGALGHNVPPNDHEQTFRDELRARWLDRFLWDVHNGVEDEARAVMGAVPLDPQLYQDHATVWGQRFDDVLPAPDIRFERLWLASQGSLDAAAPVTGPPTLIQHIVNPAFTPQSWLGQSSLRTVAGILSNVPLAERRFASAPFSQERELGERPRVSLSVVPSAVPFALTAVLLAREPQASGDAMLCAWGSGVLAAMPGQRMRLDIELPPVVAVLRKGTILTLVVRNHWLVEAPLQSDILTVPYFTSSTTKVEHGNGVDASWIDLPFRTRRRVVLRAALQTTTVASPAPMAFALEGSPSRAGSLYALLGSFAGQAPPLPLPGGLLRLVPDATTDLLLQLAGSPIASGFVGMLDASGTAAASLRLPGNGVLPAALAGWRITFSAWVFDAPTALPGSATNPVDLLLR